MPRGSKNAALSRNGPGLLPTRESSNGLPITFSVSTPTQSLLAGLPSLLHAVLLGSRLHDAAGIGLAAVAPREAPVGRAAGSPLGVRRQVRVERDVDSRVAAAVVDRVVAEAAAERVGAAPPDERVVVRAAEDLVGAGGADEPRGAEVAARAEHHQVVSNVAVLRPGRVDHRDAVRPARVAEITTPLGWWSNLSVL